MRARFDAIFSCYSIVFAKALCQDAIHGARN